MSNNILEPIPQHLNDYLLKYSATTLSDTTPAAPGGRTNIVWQKDGFGNISASFATPGGGGSSVGATNVIQKVGATAGSFAASSITDDGTAITTTEPISAPTVNFTLVPFSTTATAGSASVLPAAPAGYVTLLFNGITCKVPIYSE